MSDPGDGGERGTLYDEWFARRERLQRLTDNPRSLIELRVLNYLLTFYRDSPAAHRAAWCSTTEAPSLNTRALVVMHHLARREDISIVRSEREAQGRVTSIVRRMATSQPNAANAAEPPSAPPPVDLKLGPRQPDDPLNPVRLDLASQDWLVRCSAMRRLSVLGTVDDVVLMTDLLSLPQQADEPPQEREALAYTIFRIDRRERLADLSHYPVGEFAEYLAADELVVRVVADKFGADRWLWQCPKCGQYLPTDQDLCWNCRTTVYDLIEFPVEFDEPDRRGNASL